MFNLTTTQLESAVTQDSNDRPNKLSRIMQDSNEKSDTARV